MVRPCLEEFRVSIMELHENRCSHDDESNVDSHEITRECIPARWIKVELLNHLLRKLLHFLCHFFLLRIRGWVHVRLQTDFFEKSFFLLLEFFERFDYFFLFASVGIQDGDISSLLVIDHLRLLVVELGFLGELLHHVEFAIELAL